MFKTLIKGTFILTITGLITKVIGFIYKIYLSNILDAGTLGIYQLVFPVFSICFTLFAAGIQTSVSQMVASGKNNIRYIKRIMLYAVSLSFCIAVVLSCLIYFASDIISINILGEAGCAPALRMLSFAFPVCAVSSCINGCYYGMHKTSVPAVSQLLEEISRVAFVYIIAQSISDGNVMLMCITAVTGIAVGESCSMIYSVIMILIYFRRLKKAGLEYVNADMPAGIMSSLLKLSIPLTANRLFVALLHGMESVLIPAMLKRYGMEPEKALGVYGVLTGMAMPFILFPSTITNSLSVLLLPAISEANTQKRGIKTISSVCIVSSTILGIMSTILFFFFGGDIGSFVFKNQAVGLFIEILAFLCPFMFAATTLTSIINGLGYTHITFFITIIGLTVRILLTIKLVPVQGISGYLIGLLLSQLMVTAMSYCYYKRLLSKIS